VRRVSAASQIRDFRISIQHSQYGGNGLISPIPQRQESADRGGNTLEVNTCKIERKGNAPCIHRDFAELLAPLGRRIFEKYAADRTSTAKILVGQVADRLQPSSKVVIGYIFFADLGQCSACQADIGLDLGRISTESIRTS